MTANKISNYPSGFANGVNIRGVPVLNSYPGNVWWVDSGGGSDGNKGTFDRPFATVDKALSFATTSNGDVVMVKAGHAENIADATTFLIDKIGVAVIGLGAGALRPTFTFTNTAGSIEMDSANCTLQNLRFLASVSAVVVGVNVDAANCAILDCEFDFDATGDDFLIYVDCQDIAGTTIAGNTFWAEEATAGSAEAIRLDNADRSKILGNYFHGDFSNAPVWSDTSGDTGDGSTVSSGIQIVSNRFYVDDTANMTAIDLNNADTGMIAYNAMGSPAGITAANLIDPGSCMCLENYAVSAINESGILIPATTST